MPSPTSSSPTAAASSGSGDSNNNTNSTSAAGGGGGSLVPNSHLSTAAPNIQHRIGRRKKFFDMVQYYDNAVTGTIDTLYIDGLTFFQACHKGAVTTVMAFLLGGMDPNALDVDGAGLGGLHYAVSCDDAQLANILVECGAKVNLPCSSGGMTPLMVALDVGAFDCVRYLLQSGASLDEVDSGGDPAIFYAANQPFVMHMLYTQYFDGKVEKLRLLTNEKGETLLHKACQKRMAQHRWDIYYLIEELGIDVNVTEGTEGETALFTAVRNQEYDHVVALISKGADIRNQVNRNGETVLKLPCRDPQISKLLKDASEAPNLAAVEKLCQEDWSNKGLLFSKQSMLEVAVPLFVPNTLIVIGALYLPTILGLIILGATGYGFTQVAGYALKKKGRSLPTAGWFSGALFYGSAVLITQVFPIWEKHNPETGHFWVVAWYIITIIMFLCYSTAVLRDPGVVPSTVEGRHEIYEAVAQNGMIALETEGIDVTSMVRKPFRAKHCSKTHRTVSRFDHYCVWTGNAIGGGNHRPFVLYCLCQLLSQLIVTTTTMAVVFTYAPEDANEHNIWSSPCTLFNWLFSDEMALTSYFLVIYNTALLLFVSMILLSQSWYATRNVTSNEVWFASRYKWMFMLGTRAYSFYDQGFWRNLYGFFWADDLCKISYTMPKMNDHLRQVSRAYAQKVKAMQQKDLNAEQPSSPTPGGEKEGFPSNPAPEIFTGESSTSSAATTSGGGEGEENSLAAGSAAAQRAHETAHGMPASPVTAATPTAALNNALSNASPVVKNQMQVLQEMLGQMIRSGGNQQPTFPEGWSGSQEEQDRTLAQVKKMYQQFQAIQGQQARAQQQPQQQQTQQQQEKKE